MRDAAARGNASVRRDAQWPRATVVPGQALWQPDPATAVWTERWAAVRTPTSVPSVPGRYGAKPLAALRAPWSLVPATGQPLAGSAVASESFAPGLEAANASGERTRATVR